jgi:spore maturation protein CgeB
VKILLGYSWYPHPTNKQVRIEAWLQRMRDAGIDVHGTVLTLNPPAHRLSWPDMDKRWKRGDKELYTMYENLARKIEDEKFDVFVNWNGINTHPEFIQQLPTFNVYGCFDDPESSEDLSKPVAAAYDLSMIGNIAEQDMYRSWGVKEVRFWPMGFFIDDYDPTLTKEQILNGERDVDVTLLCERESSWRAERLDKYSEAFPQGMYYGPGWPKGFWPEEERIPLFQRTKIGPNFHNSTGPINYRTYQLPANGILQICDNKSYLGGIFELNKEVVGFDTVDEAIDLTRYYLAHDDERRQIAAAGWERAVRDYNEVAVMELIPKYVNEVRGLETTKQKEALIFLTRHRKSAQEQALKKDLGVAALKARKLAGKVKRKLKSYIS